MKNFLKHIVVIGCWVSLAACGQPNAVTLSGSQNNLPGGNAPLGGGGSNGSLPATPDLGKAFKGAKEFETLPNRNTTGPSYSSPFTPQWEKTFMYGLGLSQKEARDFYGMSAMDTALGVGGSQGTDRFYDLPAFWRDPWDATGCRMCLPTEDANEAVGKLELPLTGDKTAAEETGTGQMPAVAFDPVAGNYIIVWDEGDANGASNIYARLVHKNEEGEPEFLAERKRISVERPTHGCFFREFTELTGIEQPPAEDCNVNVESSVAYNAGKFLITWTKRGAVAGGVDHDRTFALVMGKLVGSVDLEPTGEDWREGIVLSKITFSNFEDEQEIPYTIWAKNEHSAVAPQFGADRGGGSFLAVWDTNRDFVGCRDETRRTSSSIYGRPVPTDFSTNPENWGNNPDIFAVYTDPSVIDPDPEDDQLPECIPNEDVDSPRRPRLAFRDAEGEPQHLVVFEASKNDREGNVWNVLPSIGATVVRLNNALEPEIYNATDVGGAPAVRVIDTHVGAGLWTPDVVSGDNGFTVVSNIGKESLKLTDVSIVGDDVRPIGVSKEYSPPNNIKTRRPRITTNRIIHTEGGEQVTPLEKIVAYEARSPEENIPSFPVHVLSFNTVNNALEPLIILEAENFPTNAMPAVASGGEDVLTAWNGQNGEESRIFHSLLDAGGNQPPVAVITAEGNRNEDGDLLLRPGETIRLSAAPGSVDPEGGELRYFWSVVSGPPLGTIPPGTERNESIEYTAPNTEGRHAVIVELQVTDPEGGVGTKQLRIVVAEREDDQHPPNARVTLVSVENGEGGGLVEGRLRVDASSRNPVRMEDAFAWPKTRITLSGATSDDGEANPSREGLSYLWEQTEGEHIDADGSNDEETFTFTVPPVSRQQEEADLLIRLTVSDLNEEGITDSAVIRVHVDYVNRRPSPPQILTPADGSVIPGMRLLLEWDEGFDPDGDPIRYDVYFGEPGRLIPFIPCQHTEGLRCLFGEAIEFPYRFFPSTDYEWRVRVFDPESFNFEMEFLFSPTHRLSTDDSLRGWWRLDDEFFTVEDWSAMDEGHHGELVNVNSALEAGILGKALSLDGNGGYAEVPDFIVRLREGAWSWGAWIKPEGNNINDGDQTILGHSSIWAGYQLKYRQEDDTLVCSVRGVEGVLDVANSDYRPQQNEWSYVVCSINDGRLTQYINGEEGASAALNVTFGNPIRSLRIGNDAVETESYFHGLIDDVFIMARPRSLEEVRTDFCFPWAITPPADVDEIPPLCR